jgi:UDP-N-acetylglucosamine--N-acetylmuramyl-(pentapeptide) pyrophosphoryl-undecaprenol N-acetylglucosamine transferase
MKPLRVIISGGGTGGHIFPAIAIAGALRRLMPEVELLFVGAIGRMEMEKVPAAGYTIKGLEIQGIDRRSFFNNLTLPIKLLKSIRAARSIIREFQPDVAVGVGGYASGPLLFAASGMRVPILIQEQNSYAGITNKQLSKRASKICVAYEGMERFFPSHKLLVTGNPIRNEVVQIEGKYQEALDAFQLSSRRKTVLITGGSLGARTLNQCLLAGIDQLVQSDIQVIWQCGSFYYDALVQELDGKYGAHLRLFPFVHRMDLAYAAADLIVSRAGAGTISELCAVGKPVILVPSPNVAEDHQTKNAEALVKKQAAVLVSDAEAPVQLLSSIKQMIHDSEQYLHLGKNMHALAKVNADQMIAEAVIDLVEKNRRSNG